MNEVNQKELEQLVGHKRAHKYGAKAVRCRWNHYHPSQAEASHCWALQAQLRTDQTGKSMIRNLVYEKPYELKVAGQLICVHYPDFTYERMVFEQEQTGQQSFASTSRWELCVDEVKGFATADWQIKSKLFQALYPDIKYRVVQ